MNNLLESDSRYCASETKTHKRSCGDCRVNKQKFWALKNNAPSVRYDGDHIPKGNECDGSLAMDDRNVTYTLKI